MSVPKWQSLQQSADMRRKAANHEKAVDLYNQALAHPNVPWQAFVDMTIGRAYCQRMLGRFSDADATLTALAEKAMQQGDDAVAVGAYAELIFIYRKTGELKRGLEVAQLALDIANRTGQPELKAEALLALGEIQHEMGKHQEGNACADQALALIEPQDTLKLIKHHFIHEYSLGIAGKYQDLVASNERAVELARSIGDHDWEGMFLNQLAIFTLDIAVKRTLLDQALNAFEAAGDHAYVQVVLTNRAAIDLDVGLYNRVIEIIPTLYKKDRLMGQDVLCVHDLSLLGGATFFKGDLSAALSSLNEGLSLARKIGSFGLEFGILANIALCYLMLQQPAETFELLHKFDVIPYQQNDFEQVAILDLRAIGHVLSGDYSLARTEANRALLKLNKLGEDVDPLFCWYIYRALHPSETIDRKTRKISQKAWQALELGIKSLLHPIQNMSDAGLKRGYLHRDFYRRLLILEWLEYVSSYAESAEQMTAFATQVQKPGRLDEVFTRLLKVGMRLNAVRDPSQLPDEIVEEINELTGAERISLVLLDENGKKKLAKNLLPTIPYKVLAGQDEQEPDPDAFLIEIQPWLREMIETRQGFIRHLNPDAGLTKQLSVLVAPLISQGKLIGVIYCDLRGCFGRFDPEDLNLLTVLANQSAVALENADWSATLEQKVDQRTEELEQSNSQLEQRTAELTIINRVQEGLVRNLDFQSIIDLVGDEIVRVFPPPKKKAKLYSVVLALYDSQTNLIRLPYVISGIGKRFNLEPYELGSSLSSQVIQSRQPLVIKNWQEAISRGAYLWDDGVADDSNQSWMGVPILVGDQVTGVIAVMDPRKDLYTSSDVRLLSTLAASLGVALENARLFDETQRLLKETEQRNAELAVINSIQQGLAAQLDIQGIFDLVGDKIRQIFDAQMVLIDTLDFETGTVTNRYFVEKGQRYYPESRPLFKLHVLMQRTHETVVINRDALSRITELGIPLGGGPEVPRSAVFVPLLVGENVKGVISIQNNDREEAFDEASIHLLTTITNSMSVALENARLFDETQHLLKETEQRNAELAIINSVQEGLAAKLDMQEIYDLVCDKVREIFASDVVALVLYDEDSGMTIIPHMFDHGQRYYPAPQPVNRKILQRLKTNEPILIGTHAELLRFMAEYGLKNIGGPTPDNSHLYMPIVTGKKTMGVISIAKFNEHAFNESNVRLLRTLVNSMSVALENARLFDETQRLLKETEQRNAELAIINSVQEGLASKLDMQEIYDLVCDKVCEIFSAEMVGLALFDEETGMTTVPHLFDHGERYYPPPQPTNQKVLHRLKTREPILFSTYEEAEQWMAEYGEKNIGGPTLDNSHIYMPIFTGEKIMGEIAIAKLAEHAFNESDVRLLQTLVNSMSVALENARLFDETQRLLKETEQRNAELAILNSVGDAMSSQLDIRTITRLVGDKVREIFASECVVIYLYDPATNILHPPYLYDKGYIETEHSEKNDSNASTDPIHKAIVVDQQHILTGTAQEIKDIAGSGFKVWPDAEGGEGKTNSFMGVPIIVGEQVRGLVSVQSYQEHAYNESNLRLLSTLASSMGVAIENARLFQAEQERVAELEIINSIQQGLAAELDFKAIIDLVGDKLREVFNVGDLGVNWYDEKANLVHYMYAYEHGKRISISPTPPRSGGAYEIMMKNRLPLVKNSGYSAEEAIPGTDVAKSLVSIPIISSDRFLGDISIENFERENAFGESEVRLLTTIAASLGTALENARLFDETQRLLKETEQRNAELAILNKVGEALSKQLNVGAITRIVGDQVRDTFNAEVTTIHFYDQKNRLITTPYYYDKGYVNDLGPIPLGEGMVSIVVQKREPLVLLTVDDENNAGGILVPDATGGGGDTKSYLGVPIIVGDNVIGVVSVQSYQEHAFQQSHVSLLSTLAASMGVAIANARQFQAEQDRIAELQIINSIQQGLAAELDFQAIVNLVGDKLREVFHTPDLIITWYDEKADLMHSMYVYEHDQRLTIQSSKPSTTGPFSRMRKTHKPVVWNTTEEGDVLTGGIIPGTDRSLSGVMIPIISSDRVIGIVQLENYEREFAFGESELRLLTTITASLGSALENAHLFDETQRLLKETEQRNAELAIINSVQAALAAELNIQGIYDAVGDKIREIFHSDNLEIRILDPQTNLLRIPYLVENNQRITVEPELLRDKGFAAHVLRTRETIVINENMEQEVEKYGSFVYPGTQLDKSCVMVPLIVGDQARGLVNLSNFKREHAFSDSDVRLLQTLVNSMSVALENARLFNETQRLLAETEQRNSELAIINSVQAALAAELNIQGIYDAVGDKIRNIFNSNNLEIRVYDPNSNLEYFPYCYENGKRIELEPLPRIETGFSAHVARTRETLVINENMMQEIEKYGSYLMPGTQVAKSSVYVPLIVGDQVRGLVGLSDFEHEHAFSDSDVRLLQTLVNSMSVALENARLFAETQRLLEETSQRASELAIINSVSQSMSSQLQVESIVRTVGDQVRDSLHSEVVNIALYDPANNLIHLPYCYDRQYVTTEPFPYGSGLTSRVLDTKQPLILGSFEEITSGGAILTPNAPADELMPQSYLGVPIIVGDKAIGVIDVQSYKRFVYNDSHVRLLSTLASSMGVALENARLFEETRRLLAETEQRNRELAIISRIGQALAGQLDPQGIFELVGEELQGVFDAQVVAIITYDRQEDLVHWRYVIEKGKRETVSPSKPAGFSGNILRTRQPVLISHDYAQRAMEYGSKVVAGEAPKSYLGVPLIAGGEATGVITLQNIDREEAFNENDLRLLSTLALSMGVALENARLYQETQHHAVEMATLAEIGSDIASTHEMEPVLERMASKTRELMQVRDIAMYLLQPDGHTLRPIVSQGKYAEETKAQLITLGHGITGSVAQKGVAEIINFPEQDERAVHIEGTADEVDEPECFIVAPLISRGRVIGVISVYRDRDQGLFNQLELDFLVSLARQAAIAIESARLYAETERRATEMAALAEVSREISATLELQLVLERIAGQARELLSAASSAVYLLQPDGVAIRAIVAEGDVAQEVLADEDSQLGVGIIGSIVKSGVAEWINDTGKDKRGVQIPGTKDIAEGEKLLVAPLMIQERAIGALAVWRNPDDPLFNQAELSFSIGLAQQAVVAIENARLFETAQESQRRMADIINFLPDATLVIDREGKVIAWNHAIEEMTGVKAVDILGKGNYEYALPFYGKRRPILIDTVLVHDEELESKYTHILRHENVVVGEAIAQLKGQTTYLNATASALRNSKGEAVGAIESIRDITDQKKAEQELHQAKAEAEAANQAKSAFLAMMSHEIRTPMNAIIGMSGLLMDTTLNPDQREFAETIRSSGDSLLTIINDILDFSKIEAGKMTLDEQPFDLRECIEASLDLIKVKASEKSLELAYQVESGVPPAVLGDVTRVRQVLINLLGNSVKFTDHGEVILTVSKGDKKGSLHFSVRDTGIGIAPDRVSQLFRPFTQADTSISRRYGGTGLGLALSSRIVELMGGKMWVESQGVPGKGSTFHFVIHAKPAPGWKGHPLMQGEHPQLLGKRVLVVDDNATNRRILELQTKTWGMQPRECPSPQEALDILKQGNVYDLAIIDMHMPTMSGMELASEIRKLEASHPDSPKLPLVLSTSLGGREEARESVEFAAILMKPIRQSALFDTLMTIFAGKGKPAVKTAAEHFTLDPEMAGRHPLRILLAEDNVVNQKLALRLLSQMGYRADVAANGLEVLQAVKRQPYDVILMDVQMPEMDGLEATRRLCADVQAGIRPRIIAMTANAMQGDREMCLEAGMDDYLSKPIRVDELVTALNLAQLRSTG